MKPWLVLSSAATLSVSSLIAQNQPAAPPAENPASGPKADTQALDYLYNRSPSDGSAAGTASDDYRKGKSGAAAKQQALESLVSTESLLSPDFEKFLSAPEADPKAVARYEQLYNQALKALNQRNPVEACQILYALNEFAWDAGLSNQIANRVRAVWDTNATSKALLAQNDKLQAQVRTSNWNADLQAESIRRQAEERARSTKGDKSAAGQVAADTAKSAPGALRMTEEYFKSLDSKARIKLNEVKVSNIQTKAREDLVAYITTLYKSKRYGHAVLAAEFYQALFADGELPTEVANQATASLEATRNLSQAVEVFRFKVTQKQINTASTILKNAWDIGDTTPAMLGLQRDLKVAVIEQANRVRRLRNLIEARDFENLETALDEMDKVASDFDTTKPRSLVQAIKLESRMRLGKAKLFAQQGNAAKAMDEFKAAAETWPGNPDLEKSSSEYFTSEDASAKNLTAFDREFKAGNFRTIAQDQVQYLAFIQTDEGGKEQFKSALEKVRDAETAIEKARLMDENGDAAGAWETVSVALASWPEDPKLNQAVALYASKAPEFVSAINKANNAERAEQFGASLSLFALARDRYPASRLAAGGLERVSGQILDPQDDKKEPAAEAKDEPPQKAEKNQSAES